MERPETNAPVVNDVLQSDHHTHMSAEEIAKAKAHHDKKHNKPMEPKPAGKDGKGKRTK